MRFELPITGYAIAGPGSEHAPAARQVQLPPAGTKRRGGRLPLLATDLARCARGIDSPDDENRSSRVLEHPKRRDRQSHQEQPVYHGQEPEQRSLEIEQAEGVPSVR